MLEVQEDIVKQLKLIFWEVSLSSLLKQTQQSLMETNKSNRFVVA